MKHDDLVFDVGMHRGEDTQYYLALGFRVVAVEANPWLVGLMRQRFAEAISDQRLEIVAAAVADQRGTVELSVSDDLTVWSSLDRQFIGRARELGTSYRTVEVPSVPFSDLLADYGMPHYLKIDIEGSDMLCVRALHQFAERPDYVSIESAVTSPRPGFEAVFDELAEFWTLGYRGFKFIDQHRLPSGFPPDSSGSFGEATPGSWDHMRPALARAAAIRLQYDIGGYGGRWSRTWPGRAYAKLRIDGLHRPQGWYDLHAKLG